MKKPDECETCEDRKAGNCEKWAKDPARTIPDMSADIETVRTFFSDEFDLGAAIKALDRIEQVLDAGRK